MMQYPLQLTFKIWAFAPQILVNDVQGSLIFYVKQKLFKLKEAITIFADAEQKVPLFYINADRIIDFSARYDFTDSNGNYIGAVKRRGLKSLWRARYDVFDGEINTFVIQEKNPWVKVADALFSEIPVIGIFSGYVFNPVYLVSRADNDNVVMRLEKNASFLSRRFSVKAVDQINEREEQQILLSLIMMLLLERTRG